MKLMKTDPGYEGKRGSPQPILRSHWGMYELFVQPVYSGRLQPYTRDVYSVLGTFAPYTRDDYYTRDVIFRPEYEKRHSIYQRFIVELGTFTPYTRDDYCKRPELAGAFLYQNGE